MLPGTLFYGILDAIDANDTGKALRWVSGQYPKLDLGSVLVTINTDGTATFPVPSGFDGRIAVGDFIQTDTTYLCLAPPSNGISVSLRLGKVSAVTSSTITVNYVPKAVLDDYIKKGGTSQNPLSYALHAEYLLRVHLSTVGLVDLAISKVDIVMMAPNYNTAPWQSTIGSATSRIRSSRGRTSQTSTGRRTRSHSAGPLLAGTPSTLELYGADVRGINTIQVF